MPETCFVLYELPKHPFSPPAQIVLVALSFTDAVNHAFVRFDLSFDESQELHDDHVVHLVDTTLTIEEVPLKVS